MSKARGPSGGALLLRGEGLQGICPRGAAGAVEGGRNKAKQGRVAEGRWEEGWGEERRKEVGEGTTQGFGPSQGIKQTDRRGIRISLGDDWHQTGERGNAHGTAGDARQGWGGVGRVLPSGIVSC